MMANVPTESSLVSAINWEDQAVSFKDFGSKYTFPNLVRVTKGQYRNIGAGKALHNDLYLHSITISNKVLAQSVKLKEGKRAIVSDQKYSLPFTYQGWFEVLSEDGKSIRALQTVQDLVRSFPPTCLVRDNIKAYIARESGDLGMDRMRTIHSGELLTLVGEMTINVQSGKSMSKRRVLRCLDANGDNIYFGVEQKGLFSPVAGQTNISGVHNIKGLLEKFRLPIMVRLVHGIIPSKLEKNFTGVFRLSTVYSDETAFVLPLSAEGKMLPISTREPLVVVASENFDSLDEHEEFIQIQQKCNKMISSYQNSIHVLYSTPEPEVLMRGKQELRKKSRKLPEGAAKAPATNLPAQEEDLLFLEVEDIYQYVREGGPVPPPPRTHPVQQQQKAPKQNVRKSAKNFSLFGKRNPPDKASESSQQPQAPAADATNKTQSNQVATSPTSPELVPVTKIVEAKSSPKEGEDYWEEPIYEPLEKIRQKKLADDTVSVTEHPSQVVPIDKPVENLRQVIKSHHHHHHQHLPVQQAQPRTPSPAASQPQAQDSPALSHREMISPEIQLPDGPPPPVPPKHYDLDETEATMDLFESTDFLTPQDNVERSPQPQSSPQPQHSPRRVVHVPGMDEGMARAHSLANNNHTALYHNKMSSGHHRVSPQRSGQARANVNASNYIQHPPYVAVARVVHSTPNGTTVTDRPGLRKTESNNSNSRQKVQGMYL